MLINKTTIYNQVAECLVEDMDGELLLYNPTSATTLHFNGPSALVWRLCDGKNSVQKIIDLLSEAYVDQVEQIEGDVLSVISEFAGHEIIVPAETVQ